ncbi:uncharacterized protein LOC111108664 isoform X2 [Crassostrea virginica]
MTTRRSRLQIRPNLGLRIGAKPSQAENEKAKEKSQGAVKSPVHSLQSVINSPIRDPDRNEKKQSNKNMVEANHKLDEMTCNKKTETDDQTAIVSPKEQNLQYTALRTKIKARPNLNFAGKLKRTMEEPYPKCPTSPLKSPRQNIPAIALKSPPNQSNLPSCPSLKHVPSTPMPDSPKFVFENEEERTEKPKQVRKQAKVDIPKDAPLDKTSMKMSDLIFWNPNRNFMSNQNKMYKSSKTAKKDLNPLLQASEEERRVDEGEEEEAEGREEPMPVPQVKIGPDGTLIINEESLVVKTKKAVIEEELETLDETDNLTTYASFRKPLVRQIWSKQETEKFYYALSSIGTDFTLMLKVFPSKTRSDLKKKFVKEDKENRWKIEVALRERKPFDMETFRHFDELVAKEKQDKEKEKERTKKSKAKQRQLGEDKTSNISSTSLRRSKRKSTGPEKSRYFDYSNMDIEDDDAEDDEDEDRDEDYFEKANPTPAKLPKGNSKTMEQDGTSVKFSALNESEIARAVGDSHELNNGQGPLILVYNKPEDPAGETVIHVYRLQPQFSHLAENTNGQPIIVDGNDFQLIDNAEHKYQGIRTIKGENSGSDIRDMVDLPTDFLTTEARQVLHIPKISEPNKAVSESQVFIPQNVMTLAHNTTPGRLQTNEGIPGVVNARSEMQTEEEVEESVSREFQSELNFAPVSGAEIAVWCDGAVSAENSTQQKVCVEHISGYEYIDVNLTKEDT